MDRRALVLASLCALLVASVATPAIAATGSIDGFEYAGTPADQRNDVRYLWANESHEFQVSIDGEPATEYELCLDSVTDESEARLSCTTVTTSVNGTANATVVVDDWPDDRFGKQQVTATLSTGNESVANQSMTVFTAAREGDMDGDGLSNEAEVESGTDMANADTDGDGIPDGEEVKNTETDPTESDTDGDGIADGREVNDLETNPTSADTDGDGISDGKEVNVLQTDPTESDTDDDGLDDGKEVNVHGTDPTKADTDEDGLEDGKEVNVRETDPTVKDTDGDGLSDAEEVNEFGTNPTKADTDEDGLGDGVEVHEYGTDPTEPDTDGDGVNDGTEIEQGSSAGGTGAVPLRLLPAWLPNPALVVGALMALLVGAAIVNRRLRVDDDTVRGPDAADAASAPERSGSTPPVSGSNPSSDGTASAAGGADAAGGSGTADAYLTDEERVLQMLRESGGRLPQSAVVDETDWSKSKVSRLLSAMADDGQIRKIDLGGRNLITLPESVPESAQSREEREEREE